jgi:DNA-binding NtrC family response regulator
MNKILVVDDDNPSLENVARFLRLKGYQVEVASNGYEAGQLIDKTEFDLVLSDLIMPGVNGLDLLKRTRSIAPEIPVVLMSAFPGIEVTQIFERGAADFIPKPLDLDKLLSQLKRVLEQKSGLG